MSKFRLLIDWVILTCVDLALAIADFPARALRFGGGGEAPLETHR